MLELLIIYLSTIIISKTIDSFEKIVMRKDITDAGYKFKNNNQLNNDNITVKTKSNTLLIPFYNIYDALLNIKSYYDERLTFLTNLNMLGLVEEMTTIEKREYEKNPSYFNAYFYQFKLAMKRLKSLAVDIDENNIIFYKIDEYGIKLIDSDGDIAYKSELNQTNIVIDHLKKCLDIEEERLFDTDEVDINEELINEIEEIECSKSYLMKLKESLLNEENYKKLTRKL